MGRLRCPECKVEPYHQLIVDSWVEPRVVNDRIRINVLLEAERCNCGRSSAFMTQEERHMNVSIIQVLIQCADKWRKYGRMS